MIVQKILFYNSLIFVEDGSGSVFMALSKLSGFGTEFDSVDVRFRCKITEFSLLKSAINMKAQLSYQTYQKVGK